jgi:hypothetical protein
MEESKGVRTPNYCIEEMLKIQNELNIKSYNVAWLEKGGTEEFDYSMAAGDEAHEYARSLPFEWWKKNAPDRQNQVTEIVDAWHFVMSQLIIDNMGNIGRAYATARDSYLSWRGVITEPLTEKKATKLFVAAIYLRGSQFASPCDYMSAFWSWCDAANVDLDLLYARYIAKATLNKFRVENGYKEGKYTKSWCIGDERGEDNYFLSKWVDHRISIGHTPTADDVSLWLPEMYAQVLRATAPATS